jgi:hypothetical protein
MSNSGLQSGFHQGVKTGMSFSPMRSGLRNGYINGLGNHDKVQDPTVALGFNINRRPVIFWIADYSVYSGTTLTTMYNLICGGEALTLGSSPAFIDNGFLSNRAYIDFNSAADRIYTVNNVVSGQSELTVTMLVKLTTTGTRTLFYKVDSAFTPTVGDLQINAEGTTKIRVTLTGNPTTTSAVYDTYAPIEGQWFILTVKVRLNQPQGPGSELEIYVNGTQNQTPITTTFGASTSTFVADPVTFGNNASLTQGGSQIAGAFVATYYLNSIEQIRIENFFRWFYGYRF